MVEPPVNSRRFNLGEIRSFIGRHYGYIILLALIIAWGGYNQYQLSKIQDSINYLRSSLDVTSESGFLLNSSKNIEAVRDMQVAIKNKLGIW